MNCGVAMTVRLAASRVVSDYPQRLPHSIYGKASQQDPHCHPCNQNEIFQGSHINVATRWRGEEEMDNDHATYVNPLDSP